MNEKTNTQLPSGSLAGKLGESPSLKPNSQQAERMASLEEGPRKHLPRYEKYRLEFVGKYFGGYTVLSVPPPPKGKRQCKALCKCDCGIQNMVFLWSLKSGRNTMCRKCSRKRQVNRHDGYKTPEYSSWKAMKARCSNINQPGAERYVLRGITVCKRWINSFPNFLADMGPRPSVKHSIDRINNDGNYEPGNCRWATIHQQKANTSKTLLVDWNGEKIALSDLCEKLGVSRRSVYNRIHYQKWTLEDAINRPKLSPSESATKQWEAIKSKKYDKRTND